MLEKGWFDIKRFIPSYQVNVAVQIFMEVIAGMHETEGTPKKHLQEESSTHYQRTPSSISKLLDATTYFGCKRKCKVKNTFCSTSLACAPTGFADPCFELDGFV